MARIAIRYTMLANDSSGLDALYKINYTLKYKVTNPKEFYKLINNINNLLPTKLNDELRLYDDGYVYERITDISEVKPYKKWINYLYSSL